MVKVIAVDGPAGAGKSTISKILAQRLGFKYIDTGAMYRAVTWYALNKGIDLTDQKKLTESATKIDIRLLPIDQDNISHILIGDQDITVEIREPIIDQNVSQIAKIKGVRKALVKMQQKMASTGNIIMDGRDIGTRVLPNADLKLFITASLEERAWRRFSEQKEKKLTVNLEKTKEKIAVRDKIDTEREYSPLIKADEAIVIDTTDLSIEQVVEKILKIIKKGEKNGKNFI